MVTVVVEDGTGLSTANSYSSEANATTYLTDYAHTVSGGGDVWDAATSGAKGIALVSATEWIDKTFGGRFKGISKSSRVSSTGQALEWPRQDVQSYSGDYVDANTIPTDVARACAYAAFAHLGETSGLMPDIATPGTITLERDKVGELETEVRYQGGKGQIKKFTKVERLLSEFLLSRGRLARS